MKKNSKILMVLALALVFTIAAGICVYQILSPQRSTVYVFNKSYEAGTPLAADMLTPIQVDSNIVIAGGKAPIEQRFITSAEFSALMRTGDSLKTDVGEGTPLMLSLLSTTGGSAIEMIMQDTAVAVTVDVNSITGVTNNLAAGASVNVYVNYHTGGTNLLLEKVRVLAVHKGGSSEALSGATLELTNAEALRVIDATKNGSIYLGLVNTGGYQLVDPDEAPTESPETDSNVDDALPSLP